MCPNGDESNHPRSAGTVQKMVLVQTILGGGFKYVLFSHLLGEDFQFDKYFSRGLKPPTSSCFIQILDFDSVL